MVLAILGILLVLSLALTRLLFRRNLFNPLVVFFSIWFISFVFYELDDVFHVFYVRLSPKAEWLFIASFVSVFVGSLSIAVFRLARGNGEQEPGVEKNFPAAHLDWLLKVTRLLLVLFLAGVAWKYGLLIRRFGNPFANLALIRQSTVSGEFTFPIVSDALTILSYVCIANLGFLLVTHPNRRKIVLLTLVVMVGAYLRDTTVGGRGSTMINGMLLVCSVFAGAVAKGVRLRARHYIGGMAALFGVILLITTILFLRDDTNSRGYFGRLTIDSYLYLVGTIPAASVFFDHPWVSNFPLFQTMGGIYRLADVVMRNSIGVPLLSAEDQATFYAPITRGPFNASGHLTYYYADAGELGVVIISFAIGLISTLLFCRALRGRRILDAQLYAMAMVYMMFTIRGVMTAGPSFWLTIGFLCVQYVTIQYFETRRLALSTQPAT